MQKISTRKTNGFTLIELMITVAIVSLLSAIAIPSYNEYVARSKRTELKSVLQEAGQWMERHYSENYRYDQNTAGTAIADIFPAGLTQVPRQGTAAYTIAVSQAAARSYTLTATRAAAGPMAIDKCGDFTLTNTGVRATTNYSSQYTSAAIAATECWR
jgi:type IV pilus assembly protein PilE